MADKSDSAKPEDLTNKELQEFIDNLKKLGAKRTTEQDIYLIELEREARKRLS